MKTMLFALAAVAALAVTARPAAAQYPAPGPYGPGPVVPATLSTGGGSCAGCDGGYGGYGGYGGHLHGVGGKLKGGLFGFGLLGGLFSNHGGGGGPRTLPAVDPRSGNAGQLAFPQNPFVRGPRDYFMWDER